MLHTVPSRDNPSPCSGATWHWHCPRVPWAVGGSRKPKFHVWTQFITLKAQRGSRILQRMGQGQGALLTQILIRIPQTPISPWISTNPQQTC